MVLQSEFVNEIANNINSKTFTLDTGESSSVTFFDNSLDTTNLSDSSVTTTINNNQITFSSVITTSECVGDTINAFLLKDSNGAVNKSLITSFVKDDSTQITIKFKQEVFSDG